MKRQISRRSFLEKSAITLGTVAVGAISDRLGGGASGLQWGLIWTLPVFALSIVTNLILAKYYPEDSAKCSDLVYAEK